MYYEYCLTYYDEYEDEEVARRGITWAKSYSEAVKNVSDDYGEDCICKVSVLFKDDCSCYELEGQEK